LSIWTGAPLSRISPASLGWAPARIFIRVDLPAPFSPSSAWTSPTATVRETSSRARTPGYCLLIWRISSAGTSVGICVGEAVTFGSLLLGAQALQRLLCDAVVRIEFQSLAELRYRFGLVTHLFIDFADFDIDFGAGRRWEDFLRGFQQIHIELQR